METEFLKTLVLVFGVSALTVYLLHKFRVHPVVGFMVAGIIIRPEGLGIISDSRQIETLADIGVILLLFTVGMEFSKKKLFRAKRAVIAGAGQVFLTIIVSAIVAYPFMENMRAAVFSGFLISLSSTAIVLKILIEEGQMDSSLGLLMTGILVFQDICVVPLMLFMPALSGEGIRLAPMAMTMLKALLIAITVFLSARWIVPGLLRRAVQTGSRELFGITVILVCLGIALLTSRFGLSLALGAFLAGIVMADSGYAFEAMAGITPFKDIFMGLFFVSVGMMLDVQWIISHSSYIFIATIAVVSIKVLCTTVPLLSVAPLGESLRSGFGLAQIGEFSFVLAAAGEKSAIISGDLYQLFLCVTVFTMAMTPFALKAAPSLSEWLIHRRPIKWILNPLPIWMKRGL